MKVLEGILLVHKPTGMTSHDVVARVRRKFNIKKVGHAGTLDPLATGLLIMLIGKATKQFDRFMSFDKAYRAQMILGQVTDSADTQGQILSQKPIGGIDLTMIENAALKFKGEIKQVPPMVSAVKVNGKKLYELARQGIEIQRQPRLIRIDTLDVQKFQAPHVDIFVRCSKGTYIRQLAADIGDELRCGACISAIERTEIGPYHLDDAVELDKINESDIRDIKI